jgi:glucan phosphoethanolaminetransferase (alkaline phosphatase superfamily)
MNPCQFSKPNAWYLGGFKANRSLAYELWEVLELLPFHDRADVTCYFLVTFCYVMLCLVFDEFLKPNAWYLGVGKANMSLAYELWEVLELLPFHDRAEVTCYFLVKLCYFMLCLDSV